MLNVTRGNCEYQLYLPVLILKLQINCKTKLVQLMMGSPINFEYLKRKRHSSDDPFAPNSDLRVKLMGDQLSCLY